MSGAFATNVAPEASERPAPSTNVDTHDHAGPTPFHLRCSRPESVMCVRTHRASAQRRGLLPLIGWTTRILKARKHKD